MVSRYTGELQERREQVQFGFPQAPAHPKEKREHLIAQDIVCLHWRIERIENVKTANVTTELNKVPPGNRDRAIGSIMNSHPVRRFDKYLATERRAYESDWRRVHAMQKERKANERRYPDPVASIAAKSAISVTATLPHIH